jgi:hypothetical protein
MEVYAFLLYWKIFEEVFSTSVHPEGFPYDLHQELSKAPVVVLGY